MIERIGKLFPIFECGGVIRDDLLGVKNKDIDYVVIAQESIFESRFPELKRVGKDFPVYLWEGKEIALTRSGDQEPGLIGVSLHADSKRRDLTCNALYRDIKTGEIIDFYTGREDIKNKIFRCCSEESFTIDPLRIIRLARFWARYSDWVIDDTTYELARKHSYRLSEVSANRIEIELSKVYKEADVPSRFFDFLATIGGLNYWFPEIEAAIEIPAGKLEHHPEGSIYRHLMNSFDKAKECEYGYEVAIAALLHDLGKVMTPKEEWPSHIGHETQIEILDTFLYRHVFPVSVEKLAKTVFLNHMKIHQLESIKKPTKLIRIIRSIRSYMWDDFIAACDCDSSLNGEQIIIWENLTKTIKETEIDIPKEITDKGKDAITFYIENIYAKKYKHLTLEMGE